MTPPYRLLMTTDAVGGVWQYSIDLARGLVGHGIGVDLTVLGPRPTPEQIAATQIPGLHLIQTDLPLDWLAKSPGDIIAAGARIGRIASELRAALVHLNSPALAAAGGLDRPVVAMVHSSLSTWWARAGRGAMPDDFRWKDRLLAQGLARADRIVAPSFAFARDVQATHRLAATPNVVRNGRRRVSSGAIAMHNQVFATGRWWDPAKNVEALDQIADRLAIPFLAAGAVDGPHGERVSTRALHMLGRIEDDAVAERLAARPIYVSAARYEPFGLGVLEAAAAGCALVLADIPTFRELWDDAALFVSPDDVDGFVAAIELLVGNDLERARLGARAQRRAGRYTVEAVASGMADIYQSLVRPPLRPARAEAAPA